MTIPTVSIDAQSLTNQLNTQLDTISDTPAAVNTRTSNYADTLASRLQGLWDQPTRAEVGGRKPSVTVRLIIRADGRILSKKLVRPSGIPAMDASVNRLLQNLKTVPAFPANMTQDKISLDIELRVTH